jgi:hypothetical protein
MNSCSIYQVETSSVIMVRRRVDRSFNTIFPFELRADMPAIKMGRKRELLVLVAVVLLVGIGAWFATRSYPVRPEAPPVTETGPFPTGPSVARISEIERLVHEIRDDTPVNIVHFKTALSGVESFAKGGGGVRTAQPATKIFETEFGWWWPSTLADRGRLSTRPRTSWAVSILGGSKAFGHGEYEISWGCNVSAVAAASFCECRDAFNHSARRHIALHELSSGLMLHWATAHWRCGVASGAN